MFRLGVTRDLRAGDGRPAIDIGLDEIERDGAIDWAFLPAHGKELTSTDVTGFDAILAWDTAVGAATVTGAERLVYVARLGVGLDAVDVPACTAAGVLVTITPDAVRRPVASGAVALMLALSHRVTVHDREVRRGRWSELGGAAGAALTRRTLGIVGLGNIGCEVARLVEPWEMTVLASDPSPPAELPRRVALRPLDNLLRASDFIVLSCPLTADTRHLIDADRLALMKPTACLINVARGGLVDTAALVSALRAGALGGAALDVLEHEPPAADDPLLRVENVILSRHAIALTDDFNLAVGASAIAGARAVAGGHVPPHLVNPEALCHPRFLGRLGGTT